PGFGLSVTLPRLVGAQQASALFYTGRRIGGEEAHRIGLADVLVAADEVRSAALSFASEIATSAPLAVEKPRKTLRGDLYRKVVEVNKHERDGQRVQFKTEDFKEGVRAMAERRAPQFRRGRRPSIAAGNAPSLARRPNAQVIPRPGWQTGKHTFV